MYANELYHYGVKGMKWGIRRYQNADGSLTDAGRRRYGYTSREDVQRAKSKMQKAADASNSPRTYAEYRKAKAEYKTVKKKEKLSRYADKLERKAGSKTNKMLEETRATNKKYQDLKKNGINSLEWERHIRSKYLEDLQDDEGNYRDPSWKDYLKAGAHYMDRLEMNTYMSELRNDRNNYASEGRKWARRTQNLMNYSITDTSSKKEIRDIYKGKIKKVPERQNTDVSRSQKMKGDPNNERDMNRYANRTAFMDEYKPVKGSKNTLRDIDDFELIDLNIDDPSFRKEYGVSDSDYRKYKKMMG